jgi:uncharacterized protein (TIGR00251 family)
VSARFAVHVQPRARRTEVAGEHGEAVKIRLAAPPVDGAANEALRRFLAERLCVPRAAVRVVAGLSSRDKMVEVDGFSAAKARQVLLTPPSDL